LWLAWLAVLMKLLVETGAMDMESLLEGNDWFQMIFGSWPAVLHRVALAMPNRTPFRRSGNAIFDKPLSLASAGRTAT
jgi:hypothetical protein